MLKIIKNTVILFLLAFLLCMTTSCCTKNTAQDNYSETISNRITFSISDTKIQNEIIFQMPYEHLKKILGAPLNIEKGIASSTADENGVPVVIAQFPGLLCEFYDTELINGTIPEDARVFRFDILDSEYPFLGISVGMNFDEISKALSIKQLESMKVLKSFSPEDDNGDLQNQMYLYEAKKLLTINKSSHYFDENDGYIYLKNSFDEADLNLYPEGIPFSLGAVLLFQDQTLTRIVFGFPTAD